MAGETPRANQARKKRPNWQDDRSTGKYYESGDVSALGNSRTVADSHLKPGQEPVPNVAKLPKQDDRAADKYYRNATPQAPTLQQIQRGHLGTVPQLGAVRKPTPAQQKEIARRAADPNAAMTVNDPTEVNGVMQAVAEKLQSGESGVVVYVKAGDNNLLRRARAALEMLVTREVITEEQYHDVRLSYAPSEADKQAIDAKLGAPAPAGEVKLPEQNVESADPEDFLAGIKDEEEAEAAMANVGTVKVTEVDTTNDVQDSPAPEYPSAPTAATEDDDDSDFLAPAPPLPEAAQEPTLAEANAALEVETPTYETPAPAEVSISSDEPTPEDVSLPGSIETPAQAMDGVGDAPKKKPGKRSGRGS